MFFTISLLVEPRAYSGAQSRCQAGPRLVDAYGEQEAARLVGLLTSSVESMHTMYHNQFASMSYPPVSLDRPPEAYFVSMMPGVGASGPRTMLILPSLAGQDNPPLGPAQRVIQHFGQEEGSRIVSMNDSVANLSYTLFRTRPDLSYTSAD